MTAVGLSGLLDAVAGEPPTRLHPVVGMGRYLDVAARLVPAGPPTRARVSGGVAWAVGLGASVLTACALEAVARRLPAPVGTVLRGVVLWPLWSGRLLLSEVAAVEAALAVDLDTGRRAVARVVSRPTGDLTADGVRAAALETLAENLSDSVVAPLLWAAIGGVPAAAAYRFVNTADAVWGYRTPRWRDAGTVAARADDVANLVPARLTAVLLLVGAPRSAWRSLVSEARRTPSPNSGWPMAALALRLDRRLAKPGAYVLHPGGGRATPADTREALRLARRAVMAVVVAGSVLEGARAALASRGRRR